MLDHPADDLSLVWTHLQHRLDTRVADLLPRCLDTFSTLLETETSLHKLLAMLDQKVPNLLVTDRGNLDEFCETVSDLSDW